jgi:hypothetical protein
VVLYDGVPVGTGAQDRRPCLFVIVPSLQRVRRSDTDEFDATGEFYG